MPPNPPDPLALLASLRVSLETIRQLAPLDRPNAPVLMELTADIEASIDKLESVLDPECCA